MRTLLSADDRQSIVDRISKLTPQDRRRWGKMSAAQMICHLTDSYQLALTETKMKPVTGPFRRAIVKWVALKSPTKWPKGVPTRPEMKQGVGGTPPGDFAEDRDRLLAAFHHFYDEPPDSDCPHPIFGDLTREEWMRWGWLHADHHLRQFGR